MVSTAPRNEWDAKRDACPACVIGHACDEHSECREIAALRAALKHIAETCISDPDVAQFASRAANRSAFAQQWATSPPTEPGFYWFCDTGWNSSLGGTSHHNVHLAMLYKGRYDETLWVVQCGADMHAERSLVSEYTNAQWPTYWLGPLAVPAAPVTPAS